VKLRVVVVALAVGIALGLKRHYADARAEDLSWILGPTSRLAGAMAGTRFERLPGEGYFSHDHLFLIVKACAGVNFMVAAFGMVTLALLHRVRSFVSAARVLAASLAASYGAAVLVNAVRIAVALWLAAHPVSVLSPANVHRLEGIVVYFGGLVLLYEIVRRVDEESQSRGFQRLALPLASYYVVTLAIPLAGGATSSTAFVAHALVVLTVPVLLIVGASAAATSLRR
jgi:exosortase K